MAEQKYQNDIYTPIFNFYIYRFRSLKPTIHLLYLRFVFGAILRFLFVIIKLFEHYLKKTFFTCNNGYLEIYLQFKNNEPA